MAQSTDAMPTTGNTTEGKGTGESEHYHIHGMGEVMSGGERMDGTKMMKEKAMHKEEYTKGGE